MTDKETHPEPRPSRTEHWENTYRSKLPDRVSWYQAEPLLSLAMIRNAGVSPSEPLIDVGGGASVLVDRLLAAGHTDLTVLDISSSALAASRQRLGAAAERVAWVCADVLNFQPGREYALWHDRALFHFLTAAEDRARYRDSLRRGLRKGGQLVLAAFAVGGPLRCSGLDIVQYDADKLSAELGPEFTLAEQAHETHRTPAGGEQLFAWFRYQRA
jgi:SAM-dependent methyltransferase